MHPKRHPIRMEVVAGCDADGRLTALRFRAIGDSGAYASVGMKVLERAAGHCQRAVPPAGASTCESVAVRTNNPVCGAFRGFGANQAQFAMEGVPRPPGRAVGISGWEIRKRNVIRPGDVWGPGQVMDDGALGAEACLDAHPRRPTTTPSSRGEGRRPRSRAEELRARQRLQGDHQGRACASAPTARSRCATAGPRWARACTPSPCRSRPRSSASTRPAIRVVVDTTRELGLGQTTGQPGHADGCRRGEGGVRGGPGRRLPARRRLRGRVPGRLDRTSSASPASSTRSSTPRSATPRSWSSIDRETGAIERVVAVHDVGRAVNPMLCEGQIEGSVHMGLGYALTEDFPSDPATGFPTNMTLR